MPSFQLKTLISDNLDQTGENIMSGDEGIRSNKIKNLSFKTQSLKTSKTSVFSTVGSRTSTPYLKTKPSRITLPRISVSYCY